MSLKTRFSGGRWAVAVAVAMAVALTGCGRKGALEAPPEASVEGQPKTLNAGSAPKKVPDRKFVLDGLL